MGRSICQPRRRPAAAEAPVTCVRLCIRLLLVLLVGLWMMVQVPGWTAASAAQTISAPESSHLAASEAERFDTPAGAEQRLRFKAMLACEPSITKDPDWHPPAMIAASAGTLHAGTRGSARIPAERVRQTAVSHPRPYHLRAPPHRG
jgi:hypothetical protein